MTSLSAEAAVERSRLWVAIRHAIPLDKPWRGEVLDLLWPIFSDAEVAGTFTEQEG
jgi:hypothetical protein